MYSLSKIFKNKIEKELKQKPQLEESSEDEEEEEDKEEEDDDGRSKSAVRKSGKS